MGPLVSVSNDYHAGWHKITTGNYTICDMGFDAYTCCLPGPYPIAYTRDIVCSFQGITVVLVNLNFTPCSHIHVRFRP